MYRHRYIQEKVRNFLGDIEIVYAIPGTDNHTANFYGDTYICELTESDLVNLIDIAATEWTFEDESLDGTALWDRAFDAIIDDIQLDSPEY